MTVAKPVTIPEEEVWTPIPYALFTTYSYHAMITDREGGTVELEADHRRHAVVEDAIRDIKYGVGLNHFPSGRFGANAAWLALNVAAHNLARWVSRLGLGEQLIATDTLRRRYLNLPGRITTSARRLTPLPPRTLAVGLGGPDPNVRRDPPVGPQSPRRNRLRGPLTKRRGRPRDGGEATPITESRKRSTMVVRVPSFQENVA